MYLIQIKVIDGWGNLPLHNAAKAGSVDMVRILLQVYRDGAKIGDKYNKTPFYYAVQSRSIDCVRLLLDAYKIGPFIPNINGIYPLQAAIEDEQEEIVACIIQEVGYTNLFQRYYILD